MENTQTTSTSLEGGAYGTTTLHPVGVTVLICLVIALFIVPRKYATWPVILMAAWIASGQRIMVGNLNFPFLRIVLICAILRLFFRSEYRGVRLLKLDYIVVSFFVCKFAIFNIHYMNYSAFVFVSNLILDPLCCYFFFRCLVRTWDDFASVALAFACASLPVSLAFIIESSTRNNIFYFLGGVPQITEIREGRLRCQGPYPHPILAGCFWASLCPIIAARWFTPSLSKTLTILAVPCAVICVILSGSSTPLMGLIFVCIGFAMFPLRRNMMSVRWAILGLMVCLQLTLKGNIWSLIAKVNIVGGSTGWHRSNLMEQAYNHLHEWFLLGTNSTSHWAWGLWDVTNQYILEGVRGGFLSMLLFILAIAYSFQRIGKLNKQAIAEGDFPNLINSWSIGVMLFVHLTSFFAVSYFGQIVNLFWITIAVSAGLSDGRMQNVTSDDDHTMIDHDLALHDEDQSDLHSDDFEATLHEYEYEDEYECEYEDEYTEFRAESTGSETQE